MPPDAFLNAGIGLLPVVPVARVTRPQVRGVVERMKARVATEKLSEERRASLWTATYILMGFYESAFTDALLEGVRDMKESTTYQKILNDGRKEEAHRLVLRQGMFRFGTPDKAVTDTLTGIAEIARLEALSERLLRVESWGELLAEDTAAPRN